ncbi:hypothetical protein ABT304_21080 [Nocardioides sp. NPDC000445]|uniref:hypothetical protein n=1 Tax=Nocardioides sp. NPDC000445 TaxID=3154257 RepID=UPI0033338FDB
MSGYWSDRVRVEQLLDETAEDDLSPLDVRLLAIRRRKAAAEARDRRRAEADERQRYWLNEILGESGA